MVRTAECEEFIRFAEEYPVIDVRSPGEFDQGHIPFAVNLPLFDDQERAAVGTIYKNSGREAALLRGLEFAGPKLAGFVKKMNQLAPGKEILIHCWRGGMRSEQMAWLFDQAGFKVCLLAGGYKAYRRYIREKLSANARCIILGGMTGSGKTEMLDNIALAGEQVLELEKIAFHKGSVFGGIGQPRQPTNEQFENNIFGHWQKFDLYKPIWIEDESRAIGTVTIPDPLFEKIRKSPMIRMELPREARIIRLVKEYGVFPVEVLKEAVLKISEKLGGTRTKQALEFLENNDFRSVADIVLAYYDKSYEHSVISRNIPPAATCAFEEDVPHANAAKVIEKAKYLIIN